ncbi:MAG TPA: SPFH domain-containing protein [bacterium]|nr:SPFH domain-containing protein [bacterium]
MNQDQIEHEKPDSGWSLPEKAAAAAIGVNLLLTVLKFGLAWWSKSLALKVEAFHSLADIGSSLAVWWAVRAEMTRKHNNSGPATVAVLIRNPQRLVAIFIGVFLLAVGLLFLRKIITPETVSVAYPVPVGLAMLVLALMSFLLSRLELTVGEKEGSTALVADSFHARVDMFGSLVVAGALLGEGLGWGLDRVAAGLLAVFILTQAVNVFGAVIRDMASGEERPDYVYGEWLWLAIRKRMPGVVPRLVSMVARAMGGSPESAQDRRKAGAMISSGALAVLFLAYLVSGLFTVQAPEQAIVEHLGKPLDPGHPLGPGIHWCWPRPFDRVRKVEMQRIRRLNVGSAVAPGSRAVLWTNRHYVEEFNLLSGENIFVDVGVVLHYRVLDAAAWLYNTSDPEALLKSVTYSVLTEEFSRLHFLESITSGRDELEAALTNRVRDALEFYQPGIELISLQVRDAHPPTAVAADFENVVSATIEYETRINEARGYANDLIPRARGEAVVNVASAEAERAGARSRASGDAARFEFVRQAHALAPEVSRIRLRIEAAERILPGREKIIVPAKAFSGSIELFMTATPGRAAGSK